MRNVSQSVGHVWFGCPVPNSTIARLALLTTVPGFVAGGVEADYFDRRFGNNASTGTRNTWDSSINSRSVTQRIWSSMRATMSRLTSQPANWHFAANCDCDNPSLLRRDISRGPTAFLGWFIQRQFSDAKCYLVSPLAFVWFTTQLRRK